MRFFPFLWFLFSIQACIFPKKALPALDSESLVIKPLTPNVFVHISYLVTNDFGRVACNGMIYVRQGEAVVFDTPTDSATSEKLIDHLENKWKVRIKAVVANHFHADCLGGVDAFHAHGIPSYGNRLTLDLARERGEETPPQNGFDNLLVLKVGDRTVENRYFGEGHTRDNIVSWVPAEKALFGGCLIKTMNASKGYLGDANTAEWSATVEKVKAAYPEARFVVPGHGAAGGTELLDFTIQLFRKEGKND